MTSNRLYRLKPFIGEDVLMEIELMLLLYIYIHEYGFLMEKKPQKVAHTTLFSFNVVQPVTLLFFLQTKRGITQGHQKTD